MGVIEARRRIMLNEPHIVTPTAANPVSFSTDMIAPLNECRAWFAPVQSGTGDPSPQNVRPITGWTGTTLYHSGTDTSNPTTIPVTFPATGKNLCPAATGTELRQYPNVDNSRRVYISGLDPAKDYTFQATWTSAWDTDGGRRIYVNGATSGMVRPQTGDTAPFTKSVTVKPNANGVINISANAIALNDDAYAASIVNMQLEEASSATSYAPYTNTVYGGYVDLVNGVVVAEWKSIVADGVNVATNSAYIDTTSGAFGAGIVYLNPNGMSGRDDIYVMVDCLPVARTSAAIRTWSPPFAADASTGRQYVRFYVGLSSEHPEITTNAERIAFTNAWLQEHNVQIVYKLATPITYSIDPVTLKTLRGANNVWSNANGNVSLSYWTH